MKSRYDDFHALDGMISASKLVVPNCFLPFLFSSAE